MLSSVTLSEVPPRDYRNKGEKCEAWMSILGFALIVTSRMAGSILESRTGYIAKSIALSGA
jgi:hypothetical protein